MKLISTEDRPFAKPEEKTFGTRMDFEVWSNGTETREYFKPRLPDGVLVMAFTTTGMLIMLEEFQPVRDGILLRSAIGYGIPQGMPPIEAARQGLFEKTGYTAGKLELMTTIAKDSGRLNGNNIFYLALDCVKTREPKAGVTVSTLPFEQARDEFRNSMYQDPAVAHDGERTMKGFFLAEGKLKRSSPSSKGFTDSLLDNWEREHGPDR